MKTLFGWLLVGFAILSVAVALAWASGEGARQCCDFPQGLFYILIADWLVFAWIAYEIQSRYEGFWTGLLHPSPRIQEASRWVFRLVTFILFAGAAFFGNSRGLGWRTSDASVSSLMPIAFVVFVGYPSFVFLLFALLGQEAVGSTRSSLLQALVRVFGGGRGPRKRAEQKSDE